MVWRTPPGVAKAKLVRAGRDRPNDAEAKGPKSGPEIDAYDQADQGAAAQLETIADAAQFIANIESFRQGHGRTGTLARKP